MKSLALLHFFLSSIVMADVISPIKLGEIELYSGSDDIYVATQALERGLPLIRGRSPKGEQKQGQVSKEQLDQAFFTNLKEMIEARNSRNSGTATKPAENVKLEEAPQVAVGAFSIQSWEAFCKCASKTIKTLKLIRRLQLLKSKDAERLAASLDAERGDGAILTPLGIACGNNLGRFGMPRRSLNEEVQMLGVLSSINDDIELQKAFHHYMLYALSVRGESLKAGEFWEFAWKSIGFTVLVRRSKIPELAVLFQTFLSTREKIIAGEKGAVIVPASPPFSLEIVQEEWNKNEPGFQVKACEP